MPSAAAVTAVVAVGLTTAIVAGSGATVVAGQVAFDRRVAAP